MAKLAVPYRKTIVPQWGTFSIPRYIVRIDSHKYSTCATHGWQVRFPHGSSKLFSDGKGNPKTSLRKATKYLAAILYPLPRPIRTRENNNKKTKTGFVGVTVAVRKKHNRLTKEISVVVTGIPGRPQPKIFYVATENTLTAERLKTTIAKAAAWREEMVQKIEIMRQSKSLNPPITVNRKLYASVKALL